MKPTKASFSAGEASRITKVPYANLDYWARTQLIAPSIAAANGIGTDRRYSFQDLIALRVARELRKAGISTQSLRQAINEIKGVRNPLAECRLLAIGSSVAWVKDCDQIIDVLKRPGQGVFMFMLDFPRTAKEIDSEVKAIKAA